MLGTRRDAAYENGSYRRNSSLVEVVNELLQGLENIEVVGFETWDVEGSRITVYNENEKRGNNLTFYLAANGKSDIKKIMELFGQVHSMDEFKNATGEMKKELENIQETIAANVDSIRYRNGKNLEYRLKEKVKPSNPAMHAVQFTFPELEYEADGNLVLFKLYSNRTFAEQAKRNHEADPTPSKVRLGAVKQEWNEEACIPTGQKKNYEDVEWGYVHGYLLSE